MSGEDVGRLRAQAENAKAINRGRTSYSFKAFSCAHIASAFNFEIEIKNIVIVALRTFEFSHRLGQYRTERSGLATGQQYYIPFYSS